MFFKAKPAAPAATPVADAPELLAAASEAAAKFLPADTLKERAAQAKHAAASIGQLVVMMAAMPAYREHKLSDLNWLVFPAVANGQFSIVDGQSKETGMTAPLGAVLWAWVSEAVDARLATTAEPSQRLAPAEWRSGDILWIIETFGDPRLIGGLVERLRDTTWQGRAPKLRGKGADGQITVIRLERPAGAAKPPVA